MLRYLSRGAFCVGAAAIAFDVTRWLIFTGDEGGFWSLFVPGALALFVAVAGAIEAWGGGILFQRWHKDEG